MDMDKLIYAIEQFLYITQRISLHTYVYLRFLQMNN